VGGPLLFARGGAARVASRLILLVPTQAPTTFYLCHRQPGRRPRTAPRQETRPKGPRLSTRVLHVVVKFLKPGAPLYHRSTTLATATTFRPFQEKQLVNGQAFLLARLLVSSAQVLILWGYTEYSVTITWFTCSGRRQGVARIWSEKILKVLDSSTPTTKDGILASAARLLHAAATPLNSPKPTGGASLASCCPPPPPDPR